MNSVMPATLASSGCRRRITSLALIFAFLERLQVDLNAPAVQRGVGAVDADERGQALHGRILQDHLAPAACCRSAIAWKEMVWAASETP